MVAFGIVLSGCQGVLIASEPSSGGSGENGAGGSGAGTPPESGCVEGRTSRQTSAQIQPTLIKIVDENETLGVDEPYVITLGFRSEWGKQGSTRVDPLDNTFDKPGKMDEGETRNLPSDSHAESQGGLVTLELLRAGRTPPCLEHALFGAVLIVLENDGSTDRRVRKILEDLPKSLRDELAGVVEATSPAELRTAEDLNRDIAAAGRRIENAASPSALEALWAAIASGLNPDDLIGSHTVTFLPVDNPFLAAHESALTGLDLGAKSSSALTAVTSCQRVTTGNPCKITYRETGASQNTSATQVTVRVSNEKDTIYELTYQVAAR
jgi:hypothetical protein